LVKVSHKVAILYQLVRVSLRTGILQQWVRLSLRRGLEEGEGMSHTWYTGVIWSGLFREKGKPSKWKYCGQVIHWVSIQTRSHGCLGSSVSHASSWQVSSPLPSLSICLPVSHSLAFSCGGLDFWRSHTSPRVFPSWGSMAYFLL
jgi:hypothetical protein